MSNKSDVTDSCSGEEFSPFFWKILIISKENIIVWRPENY